jgi:hypothetical protein
MKKDGKQKKEKNKKTRKRILPLIIILLVGMVGIVGIGHSILSSPGPQAPLITAEELESQASIRATIRDLYQPIRGDYGMGQILARILDEDCYTRKIREGLADDSARRECTTRQAREFHISSVLQKLPPLPEDFYEPRYYMMSGQLSQEALSLLGREYYSQPEWLGYSFTESCIPMFLRKADSTRWTPEGYGTYPHEMIVGLRAGDSIELYAFVHAGCGVENWQGLRIVPSHAKSLIGLGGETIIISTEDSKKYISMSVEPDNILLGPSYPLYDPEWIQKVRIIIGVREDTPPGIYGGGFDVATAEPYYEAEWRRTYGGGYSSKSSFGVSEQQLKVTIYVS